MQRALQARGTPMAMSAMDSSVRLIQSFTQGVATEGQQAAIALINLSLTLKHHRTQGTPGKAAAGGNVSSGDKVYSGGVHQHFIA